MSRVVDMHMPPALRRWAIRGVMAIVVAIAIGYLPSEVLREDHRAARLAAQLDQLATEARELAADNAALEREIHALRTDVRAIEDHARADLGMAYPDELVIQIRPEVRP